MSYYILMAIPSLPVVTIMCMHLHLLAYINILVVS